MEPNLSETTAGNKALNIELLSATPNRRVVTRSLFSPDLKASPQRQVEDFAGGWHRFADVPDAGP